MQRIMLSTVLGIGVASLALAGSAPSFDKADANDSGKVTMEEAKAVGVSKEEAKDEDLDEDGKLTKADWEFVDTGSEEKDSS